MPRHRERTRFPFPPTGLRDGDPGPRLPPPRQEGGRALSCPRVTVQSGGTHAAFCRKAWGPPDWGALCKYSLPRRCAGYLSRGPRQATVGAPRGEHRWHTTRPARAFSGRAGRSVPCDGSERRAHSPTRQSGRSIPRPGESAPHIRKHVSVPVSAPPREEGRSALCSRGVPLFFFPGAGESTRPGGQPRRRCEGLKRRRAQPMLGWVARRSPGVFRVFVNPFQ